MSLRDYLLGPKQSISGAVSIFTSPVNAAVESGSDDATEQKLWESWYEVIEIAATTPHSQQEPLIRLVQEVQKEGSPRAEDGERSGQIWGQVVNWANLPVFGPAMREAWNKIPMDSEAGTDAEKWVNMNAFAARLTSTSSPSDVLDFSLYGLWAFRTTLEDRNPETSMPSQHSIEAAAVWIIYSSRAMWKRSVNEQTYDGKNAREGITLRGRGWKGCSEERWAVWKQRFAQVWERYGEGDVKNMVEKVTQEMARVERE